MSGRYDAVVLLGVELDERDQPTQEMRLRAQAAAQALSCNPGVPAVVCGGVLPGHAIAEADALAELLMDSGVAPARILLEHQSRDTMENLRFAARLLGGARGRRVLVVTSDYHMRRARMTARRIGLRADGFAARMPHDAAWRVLWLKEWAYCFDLMMGWQDEGRARPEWTYRLFAKVFGTGAQGQKPEGD
ncbi:MAG: YdcF family protein [Clostridia bacterium]|nr:YdcF family protein [Clostridia bacterium]